MPKIKAFKGIHPDQAYAADVVLEVENLDLSTARSIREVQHHSFVNMLVPKLDNRFLMGSKTELAFKKINENFEDFLEKGILVKDENPSVYVYQVQHLGCTQTGIWTVSSIDDYLNNTIKKHELTRAEREQGLIEYVQQTGIDANPVLITYEPDPEIDLLIADTVAKNPLLSFTKNGSIHTIWKIDDPLQLKTIIEAFSALKHTYIADGHHRAAAASTYGIECRKLNLKHTGNEEYNFFSSVYMSTDQLRIFEFHRLVKDLGKLSAQAFLDKLSANFDLLELKQVKEFKPAAIHEFGMYLAGKWFKLNYKSSLSLNPVRDLDVSILQDRILTDLLQIKDPRTDSRLSFAGGLSPLSELMNRVDDGTFDVLFTLYPTSINELIAVANSGEVMPPKSTWFEPKFLSGLLIHQLE
ncbi:MAG: hypothetical protein RI924_360 [Bacteroidota bacterium]|jgi:uncharacterized protein (DUF1015 family)